ncbi:hypothetical protein BG003_005381 [Podila horticola]|nr:hypothetical protein BG003_005381 [Podila horticola]
MRLTSHKPNLDFGILTQEVVEKIGHILVPEWTRPFNVRQRAGPVRDPDALQRPELEAFFTATRPNTTGFAVRSAYYPEGTNVAEFRSGDVLPSRGELTHLPECGTHDEFMNPGGVPATSFPISRSCGQALS